MISKCHS